MTMKTRVERSQFLKKFKPKINSLLIQSSTPYIFASCSKSFHNIAVLFFNHKKWLNNRNNVIKHFSRSIPAINGSAKSFFACPSITRFSTAPEIFFKPYDKRFIATRYSNKTMPLITRSILSLFDIAKIKTSLPINYSCKVSKLGFCMISLVISSVCHVFPFINNNIVINELSVHRERLNEETRKGCDSLNRATKGPEGRLKCHPRLEIGHKSNRMVLNEMAATLGLSLRNTEDLLTRNMLVASASSINATGGNNGDTPTNISRADCDRIVRILKSNNSKMIMSNIRGEDRFATAPVRMAYLAMGHTDLIGDLDAVTGFINQYNYPNPNMGMVAEWGAVGNIRFLLSSNGSITQNASNFGNNVYNIPITGLEGYGRIYQDNYPASFVYRPPIFSDELMQTSSLGWKSAFATRIFNDKWVQVLKVTLTNA